MWKKRDELRLRLATWRARRHKRKQYRLLLTWGKKYRITYTRPARRWLGLRSLIPVVFFADEHDRHLIGFGWGITGYIMFAYKQCVSYGNMNNCNWWGKEYSYGRWRAGGRFHNEWEGALLNVNYTDDYQAGDR